MSDGLRIMSCPTLGVNDWIGKNRKVFVLSVALGGPYSQGRIFGWATNDQGYIIGKQTQSTSQY